MEITSPLRGEIYDVKLDPTEGREIKKSRPSIVISSNAINKSADVVIVCPVTNPLGKGSPIHVLIPRGEAGLTKESIAHCGQIRAVDKIRLGGKYGSLSEERMKAVDEGLRNALNLREDL
jgi:mRNA interferase MazF